MTKKVVIPWELKYDFAMKSNASVVKGFLYAIREEYGADAVLKLYERVCRMDNRIEKLTHTLITIFKLEGNDAETIGQWWDIWGELYGHEYTILERSKTISRVKYTKCPWTTQPKDISDWALIYVNIVNKTINPKATLERPKAMCAGDPYCEYITRIEE